ncbi:MAG: serine hydrolase [Planctomycetaceae bacterium]|nr:serine hydrolase [Planctomycetaceae bacterium]
MKRLPGFFPLTVLFCLIAMSLPATVLSQDLPRSLPETQGVSSERLTEFVDALDSLNGLHSIMVVRHGHVVAEGWWAPYRPEYRHSLFSLSKSFTSTAVGLAAAEGKLNVNDSVVQYFPEDVPENPSANLKSMRITDLLRMSTGQQSEPPRSDKEPWTRTFLYHPVPFKPGTHFVYNTSATYMQSAVVQKATGQNLMEFLTPRLFEPLGIDNPTWEMSPQGISTGGYGLSIRTEDIAKFGQLYLQKGNWHGKQLVPEAWIATATSLQTSNGSNPESDWDQGYGYQFWRCRHGAYRGDGAFGQYCLVMPEQDTVVAITSGIGNMQSVLNVIWDKLLPAIHAEALPPADAKAHHLRERLQSLKIPHAGNNGKSPDGIAEAYAFSENSLKIQSMSVASSSDDSITLRLNFDGKEQDAVFGIGRWELTQLSWGAVPSIPVATSATWDGSTLITKICFVETPFIVTAKWKFEGDAVVLSQESNVSFGPARKDDIKGQKIAR